MLTVQTLLDQLGLRPVAGEAGTDARIRWVHSTELEDPSRWLSGGELLLTTGINLRGQGAQRAFVRHLSKAGAAGIGFGTGFDHDEVPASLRDEADAAGLAAFEVPYEMPFIEVTERAATYLVNEEYRALQHSIEVHHRLEGLVLAERGTEALLEGIAGAVGGAALLVDDSGAELAAFPADRSVPGEVSGAIRAQVGSRAAEGRRSAFVLDNGPWADQAIAVPVPIGDSGPADRWLVVSTPGGPVGEPERLLARQAATVVALELMRVRAVQRTERRLAGNLIAEAIAGTIDSDVLAGRLRPLGLAAPVAVLLLECEPTDERLAELAGGFDQDSVPAIVGATSATGEPAICVLVAAGDFDPLELAARCRRRLERGGERVPVAASRPGALAGVRRAFHEARCALAATSFANGDAPEVASHRDLGAFTLLLSVQDDDALTAYADSLLEPITRGEGEYGGELLRSLEAFIEANGQWERAARRLYCHRHTLRYRIRKIEELTGRDLSVAQHRIELWLALRARELVT